MGRLGMQEKLQVKDTPIGIKKQQALNRPVAHRVLTRNQ